MDVKDEPVPSSQVRWPIVDVVESRVGQGSICFSKSLSGGSGFLLAKQKAKRTECLHFSVGSFELSTNGLMI
jgi:hypothetical protein